MPFGVQALATEYVLEWLQPSGRRPEGCCCSTELSGGRGRILGVADYYIRPIMHAPHTLRLTLANIQRKTFFRHESFDHAWQNAVRRCSTLASMYSSHAMQQEQSSSDGEGRNYSSPRTRTLLQYALRCSGSTRGTLEQCQPSGHYRSALATCCLFWTRPALGPRVRSFGTLYREA